jgi:hypothetical protein
MNLLVFETVSGGTTWYGSLVTESPALPVTVANGGTGAVTATAALAALGGAGVAGDLGGTSATPQVTGTHLVSALPVAQGGTAAATASAALTSLGAAPVAGVTGVFSVGGKLTLGGGTATASSAPVLTPTFAQGVASQLSDTSRDYTVYLQFGVAGTAMSVAIGPTSTPANTIINSAAVVAGECVNFRLPAGWFTKISFTTTTLASQKAIGC